MSCGEVKGRVSSQSSENRHWIRFTCLKNYRLLDFITVLVTLTLIQGQQRLQKAKIFSSTISQSSQSIWTDVYMLLRLVGLINVKLIIIISTDQWRDNPAQPKKPCWVITQIQYRFAFTNRFGFIFKFGMTISAIEFYGLNDFDRHPRSV